MISALIILIKVVAWGVVISYAVITVLQLAASLDAGIAWAIRRLLNRRGS